MAGWTVVPEPQQQPQQDTSAWKPVTPAAGDVVKAAPTMGSRNWWKEKAYGTLQDFLNALPTAGGVFGGGIGGLTSGPLGALAGAALGGAGGKAAQMAVRQGMGWDQPTGLAATAQQVVPEGATQAEYQATGELLNLGGRAVVSQLPRLSTLNPAQQQAVQFGLDRGIPVSAGVATGNQFVQGAIRAADTTPIGAVVAGAARKAEAQGLTRVGEELAGQAYPTPQVPETAGQGIADALTNKISDLKNQADQAYGGFRAIANSPQNVRTIQTGSRTIASGLLDEFGNPVTTQVPISQDIASPVDMRPIKQRLQPVMEEMERWMEPARRDASAGYQAIKSIVNGPDYVPASEAEKGLGGLKGLARGAFSEDVRNVSQGLGATAAGQLQGAIDQSVASTGGQGALAALQAGRAAHASKMATVELLQSLRDEPVQLFNQMTYARDAGIDKLREVANAVPGQMPQVGRAYLDNMLSRATEGGSFDKAQQLLSQWRNLGPETKKILFPGAGYRQNLDNFFTLAEMMSRNPNPSGTAYMNSIAGQLALMIHNPLSEVPIMLGGGAISKLLRSPAGVQALVNGITPSAAPGLSPAAGAQIARAGASRTAAVLRLLGMLKNQYGPSQPSQQLPPSAALQ